MESRIISERAKKTPPFIVMDILERAQKRERAGEDIIHLEIGEPDFDTPACVKKAASRALEQGHTQYTPSLGLPELREAVADHYRKKYGVEVTSDRVVITSGTSPAMLLLFGSLLNPGDEVILSDPYYACYPNFIHFLDGRPVLVTVTEEDGFQYRPENIAKKTTKKTKAVFVNSPANPTGNLISIEVMRQISDSVPKQAWVVSDEIYHGLVYKGAEHSILECTGRAFVLNGFSKLYAMTGWRLGYLIAPKEFVRPIEKLQQNFFISANSFVQWAGLAALTQADQDVANMVKTYDQRRRFLIPRLRELGFGITVEPTGAFYILANARKFGTDSYKLASEILDSTGVALTPGIDFGPGAEGYLRFSYANSLERLREACDRLESFLVSR